MYPHIAALVCGHRDGGNDQGLDVPQTGNPVIAARALIHIILLWIKLSRANGTYGRGAIWCLLWISLMMVHSVVQTLRLPLGLASSFQRDHWRVVLVVL